MKITAIKQQQKLTNRYSIFVDEKYSFSLSEPALIESKLVNGQELTKVELEALKDTAEFDKAYYRTLELIARRKRSRWEIEDYLKRKGHDPDFASTVLARLEEKGYVDDLVFAKAWISNRRLLKATSQRRLIWELKQKRVDEDIIKQALETDEIDEREVLKELVARKRKQSRYQDDQKLMQYLMRQGYNYSDVKEAIQENHDV